VVFGASLRLPPAVRTLTLMITVVMLVRSRVETIARYFTVVRYVKRGCEENITTPRSRLVKNYAAQKNSLPISLIDNA